MEDNSPQSTGFLRHITRLGARLRGIRPRIRSLNAIAIVLAATLAIASLGTVRAALQTYRSVKEANAEYLKCSEATASLQAASDYLTAQARMFVVTGQASYLDGYLTEVNTTDRRGKAVKTLEGSMESELAIAALEQASERSEELSEIELYAMRLAAEARPNTGLPAALSAIELKPEDSALTGEKKLALAENLVFNDAYLTLKLGISERISACSDGLMDDLAKAEAQSDTQHTNLLGAMHTIIMLLLGIVVFAIFENIFLILWPLAAQADRVAKSLPLERSGARELNAVVDTYNVMFEENQHRTELLQEMAETDALTGLLNRGAYDALLEEHEGDVALMLVDIDHFKEFNDQYGHEMGDLVLQKVARVLSGSVRATDYACRIGGDEFALVMTEMRPSLRHVIEHKAAYISALLADTDDGLPEVTLSMGVAFSENMAEADSLYRAADKALYVVKRNGRNGCAFYGDD